MKEEVHPSIEKAREEMDVGGKRHTTTSTAGPLFVTEKDGRIVRVEPLQVDPNEADPWSVEKNGKMFVPPLTQPILPWGLAFKKINNSENRVAYPLKRVDWDPNGDRNTCNRGTTGYERISWDEAYDILESEMRRLIDEHGPSAIGTGYSPHPEWGEFQYFFSDWFRFWHKVGSTELDTTPISWEGWAAGAPFVWGFWSAMGFPPGSDTLQDLIEESELVVFWGLDPIFHTIYSGADQMRLWQLVKSLGKKLVVIDPLSNETNQVYADRWIPIKPGTDAAMALAILHTWIVEGTYDKEYLDTHAIGWDEDHMPKGVPENLSMVSYVMGLADDGIEKTPEWASEICGVPAKIIRALAREWAKRPTSLWAEAGGACRREYAHEFSRLCAVLSAAKGIGKPGNHICCSMISMAGPYDGFQQIGPPGYADGGMNNVLDTYEMNSRQMITLQKFPDCIENPPQKWNGGRLFNMNADEWWAPYEYPAPGCSEVKMIWRRGSSWANGAARAKYVKALRSPKIETVVISAPWFDRDCRYADLVLPITTLIERQDITEPGSVGQYVPPAIITQRLAVMSQKVVEPVGESKTDMEILAELADRFGFGEMYMGGHTQDELLEMLYNETNIPMPYEQFKEKGYYAWPQPENYQRNKQMSAFLEDPQSNPLETPTGLIEIFSTAIWEHYGYNEEIPPVPHYIPEKEGVSADERRKTYPLTVTMAHPKWRFHGKYNDVPWLREFYKIKGPDGYEYEPVWMNPVDAEARGLAEGDVVKIFNDRGCVLAGLHITERLMAGTIWHTYGSWNDPIDGSDNPIDRGGDMNYLSNPGPMSVHHVAGASNSTLCEVSLADLDEILAGHPDGARGKFSTWNTEG